MFLRSIKALGLSALLAGGLAATSAHALTLPAGIAQGPAVEGVSEYTLQNGLRVLLAPDDSKPSTTVNMTYLVGSRNENYGQTGMAHLLEHMLFRGTPTLHNAMAEFSRRGLRANGSTSSDRTNFFASFAANPATLSWFLGWQADAMVNSLIAKSDLDSEMTVVRNEMESGENNPFQILMQKMQATAYQWHNYGHSTIGARSDVENVDVGQLKAFYKEYYQPDNAVLIVSGKFDPATTLQTIAQAFDKIPKPARSLPAEYTVEPVQDGEREVTLRRPGGSPLIAALYHIPAAASVDYTPINLGVAILGDTPSGRLYHALVDSKLSTGVFAFAASMKQPGYALFGAELEPGMDQPKALQVLNDTLESLSKKPFTQAELDRIRSKWLTDWQQTYADPQSMAGALSEAAADGDWRLFFLQRDQVEKTTLAQVQQETQAYLVRSNRTNGVYIPTDKPVRAPTPGKIDLSALFQDYKGGEAPKATAAFDPSPAHINDSTQRTPLVLPNGTIKLALLPKPTRGDRVQAKLMIHFGNVDELKGRRTAANGVAALLDRGTDKLSRQEIQDKLDALQASVNFDGAGGAVAVGMSTTRDHLPALIELVLDIVRNADFPAKEVADYQLEMATSIKNAMSEPSALASRTLTRHTDPWPGDDIRYTPTFAESLSRIAALKRQDLLDFHQKFYGAGNIEFAAVGAFDADAARAALTKGIEGWKKAPAYTRVPDPYHAVNAKTFNINTPDKANAFFLTTLPINVQDTDPRFPALYLANYLLGGSETSRLWNRVRVKDGLSYDVRSVLDASAYEPSGDWSIYAIQAPQNSQRLQKAVHEELARALKDGFSAKEVQEGIHALLNYRKLARAQDGVLARTWIGYLQQNRTFEWSAQMDKKLAGLTADDVNAALRDVLKPADFSTAVAGDEAKMQ
ncbi:M16 family metallopeptidase [Paralcaligenes ureilyticus]|uniref:Zinc protease n=1 Tax=Paralcaligenes ureilyticus TaxID=627131 RepID=A0A4V2UXJ6_9BURK|nr:pitrilysin family protein [Paralcaligenes ureilyticus]TCT03748.1 zinc protease [Paralcaligenes ureilyticus]